MPYSLKKQKLFKGIIPDQYFIPIISRPTPNTNRKGCL